MNQPVFVDTDIIIDLLARREPFYEAASHLFSLAESDNLTFYVSSLTIANLFSILKKQVSGRHVHDVLRDIMQLVTVLPVNETIIEQALDAEFTDFEDAVQYFSALAAGCQTLLTRNGRHYRRAAITVYSAEAYCSRIKELI